MMIFISILLFILLLTLLVKFMIYPYYYAPPPVYPIVDDEEVVTTTTTTTTTPEPENLPEFNIVGVLTAQRTEHQPFVIDPVDGEKIYLSANDDLYRDADGKVWKIK